MLNRLPKDDLRPMASFVVDPERTQSGRPDGQAGWVSARPTPEVTVGGHVGHPTRLTLHPPGSVAIGEISPNEAISKPRLSEPNRFPECDLRRTSSFAGRGERTQSEGRRR